jgi:hypothetical protein
MDKLKLHQIQNYQIYKEGQIMCRKLLVICLALIMTSVSFGYEQLLGTFEQNMWGPSGNWSVQGDYFGDYYNDPPQMVTEQEWALGLTPYTAGWSWSLYNGNMYGTRAAFAQPRARILADVTWVASEWPGTNVWAKWGNIAINSNPGWVEFPVIDPVNPSSPGRWDPYNWGAVHTRTLQWDISGYNWAGVEGSWWLQLSMSTNYGGDAGMVAGNFYIDNIRIISVTTIYVDANATGANDGSSWEDAYKYLQDALTEAGSGDSIWVAQGTYRPDEYTSYPGGTNIRDETFWLNGVAIYGGFPAGGGQWESRNSSTYKTILSGDIGVPDDNSDNSYSVVMSIDVGPNTILDGFTITAGNASGSNQCSGGGMYNYNSELTLTNCTFSGNSASEGGGGMYNYYYSDPNIVNCTFSGNSAYDGGGMCNYDQSSPTVTNCTFIGNSADYGWGGGMSNVGSSPNVTNCILWGNTAPAGAQIYNDGTSSPTVGFSDVQGGWAGTGNIDADPLFVDANGPDDIIGTEDDNLRLSPGSPCIDKGNNASVPADTTDLDGDGNTTEQTPLDLDSRPRFVDGDCNSTVIVDMGAYEFSYAYMGDFDNQCDVDFRDFAIFAAAWLTEEGQTDYNSICDISQPIDQKIDMLDFEVFAQNWLAGTSD